MSDEIKNAIAKLKAEFLEWPADQKASYFSGFTEGILLAALIAKDAGCNLAKDKNLMELVNDLTDQKYPLLKRRSKTAQQSKASRDQLWDDTKELVRRAIAGRLKITKDTFDTSADAWDKANTCLFTAIAIASRNALDDAIADIQILRNIAGGGDADYQTVKSEVEFCYEKFPMEIASIERFRDLSKRSVIKSGEIWFSLRKDTQLTPRYEDDEMIEIDARYKAEA